MRWIPVVLSVCGIARGQWASFDPLRPASTRTIPLAYLDTRAYNDALYLASGGGSGRLISVPADSSLPEFQAAINSGIYNVKAFGAHGDGIVDDTNAITLAYAKAVAGKGSVYFPPGTYNFTGINITANVKWFGDAFVNRYLPIADGAPVSTNSGVVLRYTGGAGAAITVTPPNELDGVLFKGCELRNAGTGTYGIKLLQGRTALYSVLLEDLLVHGFTNNIYSSGTVFDVTLRRVASTGSTGTGVLITPTGSNSSQWTFEDCHLLSEAPGTWALDINVPNVRIIAGTVANKSSGGNGVVLRQGGFIYGTHIEGANVPGTVGLRYLGGYGDITADIATWDVGVQVGDPRNKRAAACNADIKGPVTSNLTTDVHIIDGGGRQGTILRQDLGTHNWVDDRFAVDHVQDVTYMELGALSVPKAAVFNAGVVSKNGYLGPGFLDLWEDADNGTSRIRLLAPALGQDRTVTLLDGDGALVCDMNSITVTLDPNSLAADHNDVETVVFPGTILGDEIVAIAPYDLQGIMVTAYVQTAGICKVLFYKPTPGVVDLATGSWKVHQRRH